MLVNALGWGLAFPAYQPIDPFLYP
jgi:hypothetical protein